MKKRTEEKAKLKRFRGVHSNADAVQNPNYKEVVLLAFWTGMKQQMDAHDANKSLLSNQIECRIRCN